MKFLPITLSVLPAIYAAQDETFFRPHRISFSDLATTGGASTPDEAGNALLDALTDVGMVAVKDIPNYSTLKDRALAAIHDCAIGVQQAGAAASSESGNVESRTYADGTTRTTLATHTIPGPGGAQDIFDRRMTHEVVEGCADFAQANRPLRDVVAHVTQAFADRLSSVYGPDDDAGSPLLSTEDGVHSFQTIGDIVKNGEHLEHFHSYQKKSSNDDDQSIRRRGEATLDFHTDQGLFIAFTPGMIASATTSSSEENKLHPIDSSSSGGFYLQQKDGTKTKVNFDSDDLVFMLGDGVNQYVNNHSDNGSRRLRAVPHALVMPDHQVNESRVWHGRMVLPPQGAIHPAHGKTFHEVRRLMIDSSNNNADLSANVKDENLSIGCSSPAASARLLSGFERSLQPSCDEENTLLCWFRCMEYEEFNVSDDICAAQGSQLQCTNPRDQISDGTEHGDYFLGCTDSVEESTPYPKLPTENGYPRDEESCSADEFEAFASDLTDVTSSRHGADSNETKTYDHTFDLGTAKFMWSVKDGMVDGRLVFDGLFGYLAFGLAGPEGSKKNGMHDASIIMALPGGNYSAVTGLDLSLDPTVEEYNIHPTLTSFRHWMTPIEGRDTSTYTVESNNCFTALSFKTNSINGLQFNLDGKDELLWAGNAEDYYAGYHTHANRARFSIDWSTGEAALFGVTQQPESTTLDETSAGAHVGAAQYSAAVAGGLLLLLW